MEKRVLLSLTEYDFTNDNGERVQGATVHIVGDKSDVKGQYGYRVAKFSVKPELVAKLKSVPCVVECDFGLKISAKNEPSIELRDLNYVRDFELKI